MPEEIVASTDDLQDGQMTEVKVGDRNVLLARVGEEFFALAPECPHAGGQLAQGTLCEGHLRCPWHQARFDARTGDLEEPVSLDGLPRFDVRVEDGDVIVSVPDEPAEKRSMPMTDFDPEADDRTFLIVGAGASAAGAAEALRQDGYQGRIVMITREQQIPYDRTKLSKGYLKIPGADSYPPVLRSEDFYEENGIELITGREVTKLDAESQVVELDDDSHMDYDAALLATGGRPRTLPIPGMDLENVFLLRSVADADAIRAALEDAMYGVVVGASFIGMEAAAGLTGRDVQVTVVAPESVPFELSLGQEVGGVVQRLHEDKDVLFEMGRTVASFEGDDVVEDVVLDNGDRVEADLVIVGVGVQPVTDYIEGLDLNKDGSVPVDSHMRAADNLYAAGDIASFPSPQTGDPIRVEHWRLALQLGRIAAHNMAGREVDYEDVPFFWTDQYHNMIRYVGHAEEWDDLIVDGDLEEGEFVAFYAKDGRILAAAGLDRDREMDAIAELMRADRMPGAEAVREGVDLVEMLRAK